MTKVKIIFLLIGFLVIILPVDRTIAKENYCTIIIESSFRNFEFWEHSDLAIVEDGYCIVPVREFVEKFGCSVVWDNDEKSSLIKIHDDTLKIFTGSSEVTLNDRKEMMPIAPKIINDRTYIPLRLIAEFIGRNVTWEHSKNNMYIWISTLNLLSQRDVDVTNQENYSLMNDDPAPFYSLNESGVTARGIKIGATIDQVFSAYGDTPYNISQENKTTLVYYQAWFPEGGAGAIMYFDFCNNILVGVDIDPPL